MPDHRVNFKWSSTEPMEGLLNADNLELSKTSQRLWHSKKTIRGREVFLRQGDSYELNGLRGEIQEHKNKINNSEMLETAGVRLEEELRQFKLEDQRLQEQHLETKRFFVNTGNQRESCRRQVEMFNKELELPKAKKKAKQDNVLL